MLHPLAQDGLLRITAEFDAQTFRAFLFAFFDRIEELNQLAERTRRRRPSQEDIDRLDLPLIVGRRKVYRPTVGGMEWLRKCATVWWGNAPRAFALAVFYACGHRGKAAFEAVSSRRRAAVKCYMYALTTCASEEAIRRAALALLPPEENSLRWLQAPQTPEEAVATEDLDKDSRDLAGLALKLAERFGGSPSHWLWDVSEEDFWMAVMGLADDIDAQDPRGHENPNCWWVQHRTALLRCEQALKKDVAEWLAARKKNAKKKPGGKARK